MSQDSSPSFTDNFSNTWHGGYFEGNPLDPMAPSTYGVYGYNSVLYTAFSACVRPYVTPRTTILEIGPGRGAWTKTFLTRGCSKVYAVDAAPPEHTRFWDYIGKDPRVEYITTSDFLLSEIPDDSIDFFFSFGVFCHLKPEMCEQYVRALAGKMKRGSHGFLMIADFDKYNRCLDSADFLSARRILSEQTRKVWLPAKLAYLLTWRYFRPRIDLERVSKSREHNLDGGGKGAGWYHWGIDRACGVIESAGLDIVEGDVEVIPRDPLIHFGKGLV